MASPYKLQAKTYSGLRAGQQETFSLLCPSVRPSVRPSLSLSLPFSRRATEPRYQQCVHAITIARNWIGTKPSFELRGTVESLAWTKDALLAWDKEGRIVGAAAPPPLKYTKHYVDKPESEYVSGCPS